MLSSSRGQANFRGLEASRPRPRTSKSVLEDSTSANKSCGFDGIETKFVKIAAEIIALVLTNLYNHCFAVGVFPTCFKTAKVIPVFKTGEIQKLTNYRPVSLLSCFSKILEKLVHSRTVDFINSHHILTPTQYGFRSNHSTIHAILDVIASTYDNIENQVFTGLVLLDLAKAFDTVDHDILFQKLHHYGIRGIANNFFRSFLKKRTQLVSIDNENSTPKFDNIGVPQASTLGPLLFLIYINDLPNCINSTPRLLADDTCLMINAPTLKHLEKNLKIIKYVIG